MEKWADYLIVEVVLDTRMRVVEAICRRDTGDTATLCPPLSRVDVIALLDEGFTFATATENPQTDELERGSPVALIRLNGDTYIKSKRDLWCLDSFDSVPQLSLVGARAQLSHRGDKLRQG